MPNSTIFSHVGDMPVAHFLKHYWQKKPLLVRGAVPADSLALTPSALFKLGCQEGVEARVIRQVLGRRKRWLLDHGPFEAGDRAALAAEAHNTPWTLLVQDVNHHRDDAAALLQRFAFVPQARLDDLMVSLACDGGGVGAHVDSYDVFLIQTLGKRRWRIAEGGPRDFLPDVPVKLLASFSAEAEYLLHPGDMLYVPAGVAHEGVAVGECMTASVGFRVPTSDEVRQAMLQFMADTPVAELLYRDKATAWGAGDSATVPPELAHNLARQVRSFLKGAPSVDECVGRLLTLPKPGVHFDGQGHRNAPRRVSAQDFAARAAMSGVVLDRKSRLLHHAGRYYLNGDALALPPTAALLELAHHRRVPKLSKVAAAGLYLAYTNGYLHLE
jgi:50S ribosomal protein L16 3-hydroxylase